MTGYTYAMWADDELSLGNRRSASEKLEKAEEAFATISVEQVKKDALQLLEVGKRELRNWALQAP